MRWFLLPVVLFLHIGLFGQGTLKIYVAIEDSRHDMDIIDLNTSAINNYGVSVDSTNINFYTVTMSTQVVRISHEELFGPEEVDAGGLDDPQASSELILQEENPIISLRTQAPVARNTNTSTSVSIKTASLNNHSVSSVKSRKSRKRSKLKKSKRFKRYKGKCPKF